MGESLTSKDGRMDSNLFFGGPVGKLPPSARESEGGGSQSHQSILPVGADQTLEASEETLNNYITHQNSTASRNSPRPGDLQYVEIPQR